MTITYPPCKALSGEELKPGMLVELRDGTIAHVDGISPFRVLYPVRISRFAWSGAVDIDGRSAVNRVNSPHDILRIHHEKPAPKVYDLSEWYVGWFRLKENDEGRIWASALFPSIAAIKRDYADPVYGNCELLAITLAPYIQTKFTQGEGLRDGIQ